MDRTYGSARISQAVRVWRGLLSATEGYLFPLFSWPYRRGQPFSDPCRLSSGLVIVLPGIEGRSSLTHGVALGLDDAGIASAIVTHDWTTGVWPLFIYHLRSETRNRREAMRLAQRVVEYKSRCPDRPVFLVGHSGGAALAIWALELLPDSCAVEAAVLLAPALAPTYNLSAALGRTQRGIWNFHSWFDVLYLAAGTLLFGTIDGRHAVAAGNRGFAVPPDLSFEDRTLYQSKLHQQRYSLSMLKRFHPGGHFGWANRVFVSEVIAPIVRDGTIAQAA